MTFDDLFERSKAYLQKADENGTSVYDLLTNAILYIQENQDSIDLNQVHFEKLIHQLRQDSFKHDSFVKPRTYEALWQSNQPLEQDVKRAHDTNKLIKKQQTNARGIRTRVEDKARRKKVEAELRAKERAERGEEPEEEPEEEEEGVLAAKHYVYSSVEGISNIVEDMFWFHVMGVGISSEDTYKLSLSMTLLRKEQALDRLRFFGVINGAHRNYYIVESEHRPFPEATSKVLKQDQYQNSKDSSVNALPAEPGGEGTNRFTYWVCNHIGDAWTQLPDVTPQQINGARSIVKQFSGDLSKTINAYPPFPGNEANYLRAQIARIVASTLVSPAIFTEFEKQEPEEDEDEKAPKPTPKYPQFQLKAQEERLLPMKEFLNLENWQHLGQHIRTIGRCTRYIPPKKKGEEEDEEEEEDGPDKVELLRPLQNDGPITLPGMKKVKKKKAKTDDEEEEEEPEEEEEEGDDENPEAKQWKPTVKVPSWNIRQYNSRINKQYSVIGLRSIRWPGSYIFCAKNGSKFGNIYIGNGLKEYFGAFTPVMPPTVLSEAKDPEKKKDPSARNEKRVLAGDEPLDEDAKDDDAKTNTEEEDVSDEEEEDD